MHVEALIRLAWIRLAQRCGGKVIGMLLHGVTGRGSGWRFCVENGRMMSGEGEWRWLSEIG